jgi:hypothetical protein
MVDFSDVIKQNIEGLTDEQKGKLVGLFQNVISERVAEIHRTYDQDIAAATGKTKPQGVKTYEWMKSEFSALKEATEKAAVEANQAAADKIAQLESLVEKAKKDGAGNARVGQLEKELQDAQDVLTGLKEKHQGDIGSWESKYSDLQNRYKEAEVKQHLVGFKFRDDIPESLRELAVRNAVGHVTGLTTEVDTQGNTIYRDKDGKLLTNPENNLAPFTTAELLQKQLTDVIDTGRKQAGSGTTSGKGAAGKDSPLVINAATQADAMKQITEHLYSAGIAQTDKRFQATIDTAWKENKVSELPVQ